MAGLLEGVAWSSAFIFWSARRDAVGHRAGLAGNAAAGDVRGHVDLLLEVHRQEGRVRLLGKVVVREVALTTGVFVAVDGQLAAALGDAGDAGGRGLCGAPCL